jgi:hypothetical protein
MQMESDKQATILGMSQQRTAAANMARQQATQNLMSVFGGLVSTGGAIAGAQDGGGTGGTGGTGTTSPRSTNFPNYESTMNLKIR